VRGALKAGKIQLNRRQLIGVDCYEDLLEEIPRDEVEKIGGIVIETFREMNYPLSKLTIMGSYRRGKAHSGDVDVLITPVNSKSTIPPYALRELVDCLFDKGHVANHLDSLPGMRTGVIDDQDSEEHCSTDRRLLSKSMKQSALKRNPKRSAKASYMGVFFSPTTPGKRRRVDIKVYQYAERPYASLYFTGSAYFNRSMRQYAKQEFNIKLTDSGMIDRGSGKQLLKNISSEKEIFDFLALRYRQPQERVYFDDAMPV
jgi:DNA polymerase/3'-5' exonuclease PolX